MAATELVGGSVARGAGLQREVEWVHRVAGVPRVAVGEAGGGLRPSSAVGGAELCLRREVEREGGGRRRVDLFANSENSRDPTVNQQ